MKTCNEQEAMKMEAQLKFYAEYTNCKSSSKQNHQPAGNKLPFPSLLSLITSRFKIK